MVAAGALRVVAGPSGMATATTLVNRPVELDEGDTAVDGTGGRGFESDTSAGPQAELPRLHEQVRETVISGAPDTDEVVELGAWIAILREGGVLRPG